MKTIEEIKNWLLKNAVDNEGDLYLIGLDFSDFDGNIYINHMKVKRSLFQNCQEVGEDLTQDSQEVGGDLLQSYQNVGKDLYQHNQQVSKDFHNHKLNDNEYWKEEESYTIRKKKLQTITRKQLAEMGYKLEEEN